MLEWLFVKNLIDDLNEKAAEIQMGQIVLYYTKQYIWFVDKEDGGIRPYFNKHEEI